MEQTKISRKEGQNIPGVQWKCHLNNGVRKSSKNKQVTCKHRPEVNEVVGHEGTASATVLGSDIV